MAVGTVSLRDYDRGVVTSLGSQLADIVVDGDTRQAYVMPCPGLAEYAEPEQGELFPTSTVPVFFAGPEDVYQPRLLPSVLVRRTSLQPNFDRMPTTGYMAYHSTATTSFKVGNTVYTGPQSKTYQWVPTPFDISYEVQLFARLRYDAQKMLQCALRVFQPPYFSICVLDSIDCERLYDAGPVSIDSLTDILGVQDRIVGFTFNFDVRADIDIMPPTVVYAPGFGGDGDGDGDGDGTGLGTETADFGLVGGLPEITYVPYNMTRTERNI